MSEHDAHCEREYTPNGYIFVDCLCDVRAAKADAWHAGYREGILAALAEVEAQLLPFTPRGSLSSPQWPWHALDRARTRVTQPEDVIPDE